MVKFRNGYEMRFTRVFFIVVRNVLKYMYTSYNKQEFIVL